jgi:hypothetical protein
MDETGEHHLKQSQSGSEGQKLMFSLKCSNIIGHGSYTKERTCMRGNLKLESVDVPTIEKQIK